MPHLKKKRRFRGYSDVGKQRGSSSKISVRLPDNTASDLKRIFVIAVFQAFNLKDIVRTRCAVLRYVDLTS